MSEIRMILTGPEEAAAVRSPRRPSGPRPYGRGRAAAACDVCEDRSPRPGGDTAMRGSVEVLLGVVERSRRPTLQAMKTCRR